MERRFHVVIHPHRSDDNGGNSGRVAVRPVGDGCEIRRDRGSYDHRTMPGVALRLHYSDEYDQRRDHGA